MHGKSLEAPWGPRTVPQGQGVDDFGADLPSRVRTFAGKNSTSFFGWLDEKGNLEGRMTYRELHSRAQEIAHSLVERGVKKGEPLVLIYPPGLEFVEAYLGVLLSGGVAAPVYPVDPTTGKNLGTLQSIISDSKARFGLTSHIYHGALLLSRVTVYFGTGMVSVKDLPLKWVITSSFNSAATPGSALLSLVPSLSLMATLGASVSGRKNSKLPTIDPDDLAIIQYTSGSTGAPKGVLLSHRNLAHQMQSCVDSLYCSSDGLCVFWVPQYHDFGLISSISLILWAGGSGIGLSPVTFIKRPSIFIDALSRYRASHAVSPNFALEFMVKRIPVPDSRWDLSNLKVFMCAAEPIRTRSVLRFFQQFSSVGLQPTAFCPAYGLAEYTVGVTWWGTRVFVPDGVDLSALTWATQPKDVPIDCIVSCGQPISKDTCVVIVRPDTQTECPERDEGEIWVDGGSKSHGFWGQQDVSKATMFATLAQSEKYEANRFLRTGDLGFVSDGQLYVTGRMKDLIIVRGRNVYPQDLEFLVDGVNGVRPGCTAAFSVPIRVEAEDDEEEGVVLVAEVKELGSDLPPEQLVEAIRAMVQIHVELSLHRVVLLEPRSIPKTSSGKIARARTKDSLAQNVLGPVVFDSNPSGATAPRQDPTLVIGDVGTATADSFTVLAPKLKHHDVQTLAPLPPSPSLKTLAPSSTVPMIDFLVQRVLSSFPNDGLGVFLESGEFLDQIGLDHRLLPQPPKLDVFGFVSNIRQSVLGNSVLVKLGAAMTEQTFESSTYHAGSLSVMIKDAVQHAFDLHSVTTMLLSDPSLFRLFDKPKAVSSDRLGSVTTLSLIQLCHNSGISSTDAKVSVRARTSAWMCAFWSTAFDTLRAALQGELEGELDDLLPHQLLAEGLLWSITANEKDGFSDNAEAGCTLMAESGAHLSARDAESTTLPRIWANIASQSDWLDLFISWSMATALSVEIASAEPQPLLHLSVFLLPCLLNASQSEPAAFWNYAIVSSWLHVRAGLSGGSANCLSDPSFDLRTFLLQWGEHNRQAAAAYKQKVDATIPDSSRGMLEVRRREHPGVAKWSKILQHTRKRANLGGELRSFQLFPNLLSHPKCPVPFALLGASLEATDESNMEDLLLATLRTTVDSEVNPDSNLEALGLDSITATVLMARLEDELEGRIELDPLLIVQHSTVRALANYIHRELTGKDELATSSAMSTSTPDTAGGEQTIFIQDLLHAVEPHMNSVGPALGVLVVLFGGLLAGVHHEANLDQTYFYSLGIFTLAVIWIHGITLVLHTVRRACLHDSIQVMLADGLPFHIAVRTVNFIFFLGLAIWPWPWLLDRWFPFKVRVYVAELVAALPIPGRGIHMEVIHHLVSIALFLAITAAAMLSAPYTGFSNRSVRGLLAWQSVGFTKFVCFLWKQTLPNHSLHQVVMPYLICMACLHTFKLTLVLVAGSQQWERWEIAIPAVIGHCILDYGIVGPEDWKLTKKLLQIRRDHQKLHQS